MTESLDAIRKAIEEYKTTSDATGDDVCRWMQIISTHLYTLAEERAKYQELFQKSIYNSVTEQGFSVSRAENLAEIRHPELYMLRHIMDAAERVFEDLRSQLSWIKSQKNSGV